MPTQALLEATNYKTTVNLGWTDEERAEPQPIAVDITLRYPTLPQACVSDELNDTQCYAKLLQIVESVCQSRPFKLIEHLAYAIHTAVKNQLKNSEIYLSVKVHKLHPPIATLQCASFTIGDA